MIDGAGWVVNNLEIISKIRQTSRSLNLIRKNDYSRVHWSPENLTYGEWLVAYSFNIFKNSFDCRGQNYSVPILQLHFELPTLSFFKSYWLAKKNTIQPLQMYPWINDQSGASIDQWTFSMHCLSVVIRKETHFITQARKAHCLSGCMNSILSVDLQQKQQQQQQQQRGTAEELLG